MKLRTIRLYGKMGARFGRTFKMAVNSPAEAITALCSQLKGFEEYLMGAKDNGTGFMVFVGKQNVGEEQLGHPPGDDDIRIAPVLIGAKKAGLGQIIMGIVLIAVGSIYALATFDAATGAAIFNMGVAMLLGGVVQMLAPSPKGGPKDKAENTPSYAFAGAVNTQAQGNPVGLLYGKGVVGSAVISAGIIATDEVYVPTNTATGGGGNGSGGGGGGGSPPWHEGGFASA